MILDFEKYAMKGNEFLNCLAQNLDHADRSHAARVLRSTFRVLRNHFTFEESLQLIAQLPMAIKAVYVDGWRKGEHKRIRTVDEFLSEVISEEGPGAWHDFSSRDEILDCVRAVVDTMRLYVSEQEIDQALGTLPSSVREIFESLNTD
jgi:uncharacterized protein (DUF2267 family)